MLRPTLTIDLDAIAANWRAFDALSGTAEAAAVIKVLISYGLLGLSGTKLVSSGQARIGSSLGALRGGSSALLSGRYDSSSRSMARHVVSSGMRK